MSGTRRHALAAVCLALLTVTAGCGFLAGNGGESTPAATDAATDAAPMGTDSVDAITDGIRTETEPPETATSASEPDDERGVTVRGNLSVNATLVFERVKRLHGLDAEPPTVTVVRSGDRRITVFRGPFYRTFGVTDDVFAAGTASRGKEVLLDGRADNLEQVLAHEFAHIVHQQNRWEPTGVRSVSVDEENAAIAVIEGSAVYATDVYSTRYGENATVSSEEMRRAYRNSTAAFRFVSAPYIAGSAYVVSQVDSPSELEPVLKRPPESTEKLLHPDRNVSLANLTVSANVSTDWAIESGHYRSEADRRGELLVRELLRLELDRTVADSAANGWDNDRSLTFRSTADENRTGIAWTIRWENATEADEFAAAFDRFAQRRSANESFAFATERVANETVVVFAGDEAFVDGASASGSAEWVTIRGPRVGSNESTASTESQTVGQVGANRHPTTPQSAKP